MVDINFGKCSLAFGGMLLEKANLVLDGRQASLGVLHGVLRLPNPLKLYQVRCQDARLFQGQLAEIRQDLLVLMHDLPEGVSVEDDANLAR